MSFRLAAAAAVAAIIAVPGSAGAQVLMEKNVSVRMALAIAETALAECGDRVSVAVVDRTGRLRVFLQGDGAAPHNIELARRKAYTAETFGRTSLEWAQRTETGAPSTGQNITGQTSGVAELFLYAGATAALMLVVIRMPPYGGLHWISGRDRERSAVTPPGAA